MIFLSNSSFVFVLLFVVLYNLVFKLSKNKTALNWVLLIGSTVILTTILSISSMLIILIISVMVYGVGVKLNKNQSKWLLRISVGILLILFVLKNYNLANFDLLQRVGLSYILFRLIHFLIDSSKHQIKEYSILSFINYIVFFPSFMAGPIDEYNNFNYWVKQSHGTYRVVMFKAGLYRISVGVLKKFFIVPLIVNYSMDFSLFDSHYLWQEGLFMSLILYSFYILFDFSGYSDIAIGTAYLIGIKTPENFDNPYASKNLSVFWKKWHMTFSNFLFKYVFKPFVIRLSSKYKNLPRIIGSSIGYLYTFILCGLWHGNTLNFVYWGLWHGIGLILFKLWDIYLFKKNIQPKIKNSAFKGVYNVGATFITFMFVTLGWFFFNYQTQNTHFILKNITHVNQNELSVKAVKFNGHQCLEFQFEPKTDANLVDIDCEFTNDHFLFEDVKANDNHTYYLIDENPTNHLVNVKMRAKSNEQIGEWKQHFTYVRTSKFKASPIQKYWFYANDYSLSTVEKVDTLLGQYLMLDSDYNKQQISAELVHIDGYGQAIMLHYLPLQDVSVMIEYRFNSTDWVTYVEKREGQYDFVHIHGNESYQGTNRNVKSGQYKLRLKYIQGKKSSQWFITQINVPSYDNH